MVIYDCHELLLWYIFVPSGGFFGRVSIYSDLYNTSSGMKLGFQCSFDLSLFLFFLNG